MDLERRVIALENMLLPHSWAVIVDRRARAQGEKLAELLVLISEVKQDMKELNRQINQLFDWTEEH